jgi:hypothetical protein
VAREYQGAVLRFNGNGRVGDLIDNVALGSIYSRFWSDVEPSNSQSGDSNIRHSSSACVSDYSRRPNSSSLPGNRCELLANQLLYRSLEVGRHLRSIPKRATPVNYFAYMHMDKSV